MKKITVLGDGQVWDLRGIDPRDPEKIFEDLFCGRALGEKAGACPEIFSRYQEKGRITGRSVTRALLDKRNKKARAAALSILKEMARDAGRGIETLATAKGRKPGWTRKEIALWRGLSGVVIGGGVSQGETGKILIQGIKNYLRAHGLVSLKVSQAKFPGKESGFLGAAVNLLDAACAEARLEKIKQLGIIGIDLGRDRVGAGILMVNPQTCAIIGKKAGQGIIYRYEEKTCRSRSRLKQFDQQRKLGEKLRGDIVGQIVDLVARTRAQAEKRKINYSRQIGLAIPGEVAPDGYLLGATDYLPFFTKKDGFHFAKAVEKELQRRGISGLHIRLINDGIAAGLANLRLGLGLGHLKSGKHAFLGPGSGLGGCLCKIEEAR